MTRIALSLFFLVIHFQVIAQLPDGAIAPDWTATDLNGNTHNLYDILNDGQHVILDFGATWCGPCWDYHQSGILDELYHDYGPDGTNEIRVFMIEADGGTNDACLYNLPGCSSGTDGDWVTGTDYPIINLTGADLGIADDYNLNYYPTIYAINADHNTVWETGQISYSNWEILLFESFALDANPNVISGNCDGGGIIELNPTGGANNFLTYEWSNGSNAQDATDLPTGIYSVTCTDAFQYFESFENIFVENDPSDLEILSEWTNDISCFGQQDGSIELTVSSSGSVSYIWNNGMSGNIIEGLSQGVYDVTIINNDNNCELYASYFVDEPEEILLEGYPESATCTEANGYIEYYHEGGVEPFFVFLDGVQVSANPIENLESGNYTLEIQDGNNCTVSTEVFVGDQEAPIVQIESPEIITCTIETTILDASNSSGNSLAFYWTDAAGAMIGDEPTVEVTTAGMYSCEVTDISTNCSSIDFVEVLSDFALAEITINTPDVIECADGTIVLTAEELADVTVLWYTNEGNILEGADGFNPEVNAGGLYYVQMSNTVNGCVALDSVTVEALENTAEAHFNYTVNENTVSLEDLSVGTGLSYTWDFGDGNTSTVNTNVHVYAEAGVYEICLEVSNNCGISNTCKSVFIGGAPSYDALVSDISCFGFEDGKIELIPTGGVPNFTIAWEGENGFVSDAFLIENLMAGSYSMVLTDATGAFIEASFTITEAPEILMTNSEVEDDVNNGGEGSITVLVEGGTGVLSYMWEDGTEGPVISNLTEGTYTVEVVDENDCRVSFDIEVGNTIISSSDDTDDLMHLQVFPNPASDNMHIQYNVQTQSQLQIQMLTLDGQLMRNEYLRSPQDELVWNVKSLNAGIYILKMTDGNHNVFRRVSVMR